MSFIGDFIGDVVGGITGAKQAGEAAERAGQTQAAAAQAGIEEQRRQFDKLVELMAPYTAVGVPAMTAQQALLGLQGAPAQEQAIAALESSPQMQALIQQGENALLQQASATGGLRGGNIQAALAQFRPEMLSKMIQQQYQNLGGLTQIGQASAAGQAAAGMQSASDVANLLANRGAALAGGQIAQGGVARQTFGDILGIAKTAAGFF
jgi:hypothetical protein